MERPCQAPTGLTGFCFQAGFPPQEESRPLSLVRRVVEVFPPEPPVAINGLAGTARSRQGRAAVWRGEANP